MVNEYIRREDAVDALAKTMPTPTTPDGVGDFDHEIHIADEAFADAIRIIESLEPADVVPVSAYKQVMWERDIAVEQLKQIGKGLGEVMDDVVPVVFCKDCKFYTSMRPDIKTGICDLNVHHMGDDGFCSEGERRT